MLLETGGSGGSTSSAPKPSSEDLTSTAEVDARAAEEMADSMLRDSPIPKTEEEHKQSEDVPVGKFVIPSPPISTFLTVFCFLLEEFLLGPLNQEDPIRPRAVGLLIGIECSRVRDSTWMYLTSLVTTRIGVELAAVQGNYSTML